MQVGGKQSVVTGGGNGIGREVVLELLERGARVGAIDVSQSGLEETATLPGSPGDQLGIHVTDSTDRAAVDAMPGAVSAAHGPVGELTVGEIQRAATFVCY